jgi:hypothetical protein
VLRKFALVGAAGSVLALVAFATPAFAQSGGGCQLQGQANLTPGLNTSSQPFTYNFGGNLSGCTSAPAAGPATGTVSAGQTITVGGVKYQEPVSSGTGGCLSSTTSGTAIVQWADGTNTVETYSTTGALAAVVLSGSVIPSITLTAVPPAVGTTTINTTRYAGGSSLGVLAFQPPDPTACNTPAGVGVAGISGFIGLGTTA